MHNEKISSERTISLEQLKMEINRMLLQALSPVWAKSVQELIPGYLPDKATSEYSKEELSLFRLAYGLLGNMVKDGSVEVVFEDTSKHKEELSLFRLAYRLLGEMVKNGKVEVIFEDTTPQNEKTVMDTESTTKPKFKLVTSGGKKSADTQQFFGTDVAWEGGAS